MKTFDRASIKVDVRTEGAGFTVMELVISLGIGSIVMMIIIGGLSMTMNQRKISDQPMEAAALYDRLALATYKTSLCNRTVANSANTVNENVAMPLTVEGLHVNSDLGKGLKVSKLEISVESNSAVPLTDPPNGKRYQSYIKFQTSQVINGFERLSQVRTLPIHVNADATGKIVACNADVADQQICLETGGSWDSTAPTGLNCTPTNHCLYGGSYTPLDISQGGFINTATGAQNCPTGFTPQQSGAMDIAVKNGKYGVSNVVYPIYNCLRCGGTAAAAPVAMPGVTAAYDELNQAAADAYSAQMGTGNTLSIIGQKYGFAFPTPSP